MDDNAGQLNILTTLGVGIVLVIGILVTNDWLRRRNAQKLMTVGKATKEDVERHRTPWDMVICMIAAAVGGGVTLLVIPDHPEVDSWALRVALGAGLIALIGTSLFVSAKSPSQHARNKSIEPKIDQSQHLNVNDREGIHFRGSLSRADFKRANRMQHGRRPLFFYAAALLAYIVVLAALTPEQSTPFGILGGLAILGGLILQNKRGHRINERNGTGLYQQRVGTIQRDGFNIKMGPTDLHVTWDGIAHALVDSELILLFDSLEPPSTFIFSRRQFANAQDWEAFSALATNFAKFGTSKP